MTNILILFTLIAVIVFALVTIVLLTISNAKKDLRKEYIDSQSKIMAYCAVCEAGINKDELNHECEECGEFICEKCHYENRICRKCYDTKEKD